MADLCQARSQPQKERREDAQRLREGSLSSHAWGAGLSRAVAAPPELRGTGFPAARRMQSQKRRLPRSPGPPAPGRSQSGQSESKPASCRCGRG